MPCVVHPTTQIWAWGEDISPEMKHIAWENMHEHTRTRPSASIKCRWSSSPRRFTKKDYYTEDRDQAERWEEIKRWIEANFNGPAVYYHIMWTDITVWFSRAEDRDRFYKECLTKKERKGTHDPKPPPPPRKAYDVIPAPLRIMMGFPVREDEVGVELLREANGMKKSLTVLLNDGSVIRVRGLTKLGSTATVTMAGF